MTHSDLYTRRLHKSGLRLLGHRYRVEAFEEERPGALAAVVAYGDIEAHCTRDARCAFGAEKHHTGCHECPVEGCSAGKLGAERVRAHHFKVSRG